jgi:hypothetical protein
MARIAREHPAIDFGVTSPRLRQAELRLNELIYTYTRSPSVTEADVRSAFRDFERELVAANQGEMFAPTTARLI